VKKNPLAEAMFASGPALGESGVEVVPVPAKKEKHVAILGLGPSLDDYVGITKRLGARSKYSDEVWGINALGDIINCDMIFHMDDVRIQEIRAKARPDSNIAAMIKWMKSTQTPIMTSRPHPDYPSSLEFPLQKVMDYFRWNGYFNNTAAYAVAYAIYKGFTRISLFGIDFTYPNSHDAERGRACVEYWIGVALEKGIIVEVPQSSTLIDAMYPERERWYGYDTYDLKVFQDAEGKLKFQFDERTDLPTADEIEEAYNHSKHPNPHVSGSNGT